MPRTFKIETYPVTGGFGVRIFVDGKPWINQPFKPGVAGFLPFSSESEARQWAESMQAKYPPPSWEFKIDIEGELSETELAEIENRLKNLPYSVVRIVRRKLRD